MEPEQEPVVPNEDPLRSATEWSELISRFGHGRDSALEELIEREAPRLLRKIEAALPERIRARVGASDIFQQTLIDLMRIQERFDNRGTAAFRKMMQTLAEARIARAVRRERANKRDVFREVSPPEGFGVPSRKWEGLADSISTPSRIARERESADQLTEALGRMKESDRIIVRLIDYDDIGYDGAAERLGITPKAAQKRHSRAIVRLRQLLRDPDTRDS